MGEVTGGGEKKEGIGGFEVGDAFAGLIPCTGHAREGSEEGRVGSFFGASL